MYIKTLPCCARNCGLGCHTRLMIWKRKEEICNKKCKKNVLQKNLHYKDDGRVFVLSCKIFTTIFMDLKKNLSSLLQLYRKAVLHLFPEDVCIGSIYAGGLWPIRHVFCSCPECGPKRLIHEKRGYTVYSVTP